MNKNINYIIHMMERRNFSDEEIEELEGEIIRVQNNKRKYKREYRKSCPMNKVPQKKKTSPGKT